MKKKNRISIQLQIMDFTIQTYIKLLETLQQQGFVFQTFYDFINIPASKAIVLRHDVDERPINSLNMSRIENELSIRATYYFRIVKKSNNPSVIHEIAASGHEIGYHYEDLSFTHGNVANAYDSFCCNLAKLRKLYPVKTICMHSSPLSKWDSRDIWKKYDYHKLGIIGEPYFDIDFNKVAYLTDTGRMWDGEKFSIRDKAAKNEYRILNNEYRISNEKKVWPAFHSTIDIISAINAATFPDQVMMTFHPQRWTDNKFLWTKELIFQNLKNQVKRFLV